MRSAFLLSVAIMTGCVYSHAQPRAGESKAQGNLTSVAAGTYKTGYQIFELTYVVDPAAGVCFLSAESTSSLEGGSISAIDCCGLRRVPEVLAVLPTLRESCGESATPAPPATSAPAGS